MSDTWNYLAEALNEAKDPLDALTSYAEVRYGQHVADKIRNSVSKMQPDALKRFLGTKFMDPKLDDLVQAVVQAHGPQDKQADFKAPPKPVAKREPIYADDSPSKDKGSGRGQFQKIPARPDRAGVSAAPVPEIPRDLNPRSPGFQAMGTAGQNRAQPQPSLVGGQTKTRGQKMTVDAPVPKTPETNELERLHAWLKDPQKLSAIVARRIKLNPNLRPDETYQELVKQIKAKIDVLGKANKSTIKSKQGVDANKFFKQGGSKTDVENPAAGDEPARKADKVAAPVKPDFDGSFIGQRWSPNAYTKDFKPDAAGVKVPQGGLGHKSVSYSNQATGNKGFGQRSPNPAKPDKEWQSEHDLLWAGKQNGGWVTKSQFVSLFAAGKIRRKNQDPTKPDISKMNSISPTNRPDPSKVRPDEEPSDE